MKRRLVLVLALALVTLAAGACRVPRGVVEGTVCGEDALGDDLDWWTAAPPLKAMDRVTLALKLKVELSGRMDALREAAEARGGACWKLFLDGYTDTHERIAKEGAALDARKAGRAKGAPYDPALARRCFDTYCSMAAEMRAFITSVEGCLAAPGSL